MGFLFGGQDLIILKMLVIKIINNSIKEFYSYGVSVNYAPTGTFVSGNDFIRSNRSNTTSTCGAIYIGTGCSSTLVEKN